jgi:hypothetical protein
MRPISLRGRGPLLRVRALYYLAKMDHILGRAAHEVSSTPLLGYNLRACAKASSGTSYVESVFTTVVHLRDAVVAMAACWWRGR